MDRIDELNREIKRLWENYTIGEMLVAIYNITGVSKSQKQIDFAIRRDHELQVMEMAWEKWCERNPVHYSVSDFPEYVLNTMNENGMPDQNAMIIYLYKKHLKRQPNMLGNFFEHKGTIYFNDAGYRWIISNSLRYDLINEDEYPEWQRQSGLFAHINDFSFGS